VGKQLMGEIFGWIGNLQTPEIFSAKISPRVGYKGKLDRVRAKGLGFTRTKERLGKGGIP